MRIAKNGELPGWLSKIAEDLSPTPVRQPGEEKDRGSYSAGECPAEVIGQAVKEECPNGYPMTIKSQEEWAAIANAVNKGIDSHLEAFTKSSFDCKTGKCLVHPDELNVLLRRLFEAEDEISWGLRTDILSTLGIVEE